MNLAIQISSICEEEFDGFHQIQKYTILKKILPIWGQSEVNPIQTSINLSDNFAKIK